MKARLVARGFLENQLVEKHSPTAAKESIRILLIIAVSLGFRIHSLDVKSAFLQGDTIDRIVYLKPPKEAGTANLWRLNKCVYGLKDASKRWYLRLHKELCEKHGMQNILLDEAVFIWPLRES